MTHTQARELIAPYSLGVLDGEELSAIEEHLAGCAFCASLASEAGQVVGYLAYAAPPRRPPQNGLRRLLGEVSAIEQQAGAEVDPAPPAATADDGGPEVAARRRRPAW
ncbi:MAG: zf-HC2 domain-containing protein, partial [Chloroflexota bacterium]|nr:zf-HC2 domain-containing protein [Chloroflexota bacterium]